MRLTKDGTWGTQPWVEPGDSVIKILEVLLLYALDTCDYDAV